MNLIIRSNRKPIFPNNYNVDQIIRKITQLKSVTFSVNPYKTHHRIVRIQQFHKILCAITFKYR